MKKENIPNIITCLRIVLAIPFLYFLLTDQYRIAFYIFLVAGLSDGFDGMLARYYNWTSRFGAFMDPLADKLLMMSSFTAVAWLGQIPIWLFVIVIMRDVIILSGVGGVLYIRGHVDYDPIFISKINTGFQILLITSIIFGLSYHPLPSIFINTLIGIVTATTFLSIAAYVWIGTKKAFFNDDDTA